MKTRIDVIASTEAFENLSTFKNVEDMNITVRYYKDVLESSTLRSDVKGRLMTLLELLKRHSCKYVGVSYMHKNTIAEKMNLSYKTIQRLVKKLVEFGMVKQVPMKRESDMLQTANAIIILPAAEIVKKSTNNEVSDKQHQEVSDQENNISFKTNTTNNKYIRNNTDVLSSTNENIKQANFVAHWVPERFAKFVYCYFRDSKTIQEFWKVVKQNNRIVNYTTKQRAFTSDQELDIGIRAMKEFVMKVKAGKKIKNIFGYYNGIVDNLMDKLFFDVEFMNV